MCKTTSSTQKKFHFEDLEMSRCKSLRIKTLNKTKSCSKLRLLLLLFKAYFVDSRCHIPCYKSKFWAAVLGTTDLLKQNLASTSKTHKHHCSSVTHQNKTLLSVTQDTAHQRKALMMRKQPADTALT